MIERYIILEEWLKIPLEATYSVYLDIACDIPTKCIKYGGEWRYIHYDEEDRLIISAMPQNGANIR